MSTSTFHIVHRMFVAFLALILVPAPASAIQVAVVKSWGREPVFDDLNENWRGYGSIPLSIDTSLLSSDFTYQDLVNTGADVIWLSDPAGGREQYSPEEIAAVERYALEGHNVLGTYKVFQWREADNRGLAPILGLSEDLEFTTDEAIRSKSEFELIDRENPLFANLPNPYVTSGWPAAEVPADDLTWDVEDLGATTLLAQTTDHRGIITWYDAGSYRAIFVSKMVEHLGSKYDAQFLYNALTIPEPSSLTLLLVGAVLLRRDQRGR